MTGVVLLLSGPNLDLLGEREPERYGRETLEELVARAEATASTLGLSLDHVQSAAESELIAAVHRARGQVAAIVVNAGALTHYGWGLHDALACFEGPVIELHLTNPSGREAWRQTSVVAFVADAVIAGLGGDGYEFAVSAASRLIDRRRDTQRP